MDLEKYIDGLFDFSEEKEWLDFQLLNDDVQTRKKKLAQYLKGDSLQILVSVSLRLEYIKENWSNKKGIQTTLYASRALARVLRHRILVSSMLRKYMNMEAEQMPVEVQLLEFILDDEMGEYLTKEFIKKHTKKLTNEYGPDYGN